MRRPKWGTAFLATIVFISFCVAVTKVHVNAVSLLTVEPPEGSVVVPDDFATIQEAVDNAPEGGTVFVRNGSYRERVLVKKPLTLLGEDPKNTIISISNLGLLAYAPIEVLAEDVTISSFTIKDAYIGIWIREEYQMPQPSRCKIINNTIVNNFRDGLSMRAGENHVISGNNITGNTEGGISVSSSNCIISGNNITGNGVSGIIIDSCGNVTISNNIISSNGGGLKLRWDGPFYVHGNNIMDNQGYGVEFAGGCYNSTVYQNNIAHNSIGVNLLNFGVYGTASIGLDNIVYRNNIVNNSQQVSVDPEWDLVEMFPEYGNGGTDIVMWDNGKEGNYWSDYNGTDNNGNGIGDTPYVIDGNNKDNFPLMSTFDTASTPSLLTIATIVVAVIIILTVAILYRTQRKRNR